MAERAKCPQCGERVATNKSGRIKGHGQGRIPRQGSGGMVCTGSGMLPDPPGTDFYDGWMQLR